MTFNPKALLVTAVGALVLWTALQTRTISQVDFAFGVVLSTVLVVLSVAAITGMLRNRNSGSLTQAGAFREIQRWFRKR